MNYTLLKVIWSTGKNMWRCIKSLSKLLLSYVFSISMFNSKKQNTDKKGKINLSFLKRNEFKYKQENVVCFSQHFKYMNLQDVSECIFILLW